LVCSAGSLAGLGVGPARRRAAQAAASAPGADGGVVGGRLGRGEHAARLGAPRVTASNTSTVDCSRGVVASNTPCGWGRTGVTMSKPSSSPAGALLRGTMLRLVTWRPDSVTWPPESLRSLRAGSGGLVVVAVVRAGRSSGAAALAVTSSIGRTSLASPLTGARQPPGRSMTARR